MGEPSRDPDDNQYHMRCLTGRPPHYNPKAPEKVQTGTSKTGITAARFFRPLQVFIKRRTIMKLEEMNTELFDTS